MFENRSLDNMCGWLYPPGTAPSVVLPAGSGDAFNGLDGSMFNPSNPGYFSGDAPVKVLAGRGVSASTVPDPDPHETFVNVTQQLYGPGGFATRPAFPMQGFVVNYATADDVGDATQVMQAHTPDQVPVLSRLAREYAISDAWFASVPSQTWPNRAFVHAGTSNGRVDNGSPPDPLQWDVQTIFNVLGDRGISWGVYSDTLITPSLTRTMFPRLWGPELSDHFRGFQEFEDDCAGNSLPSYVFLEPSFLFNPNDAHPPHDVEAAEQFLIRIWNAVSTSRGWAETLLVITFDEHGGCYDHVLPPTGALPPDAASSPGDQGFRFDRFGVRVPTVLVSPYIAPGTVFRSDGPVPYDHTSILATLRDWLEIPEAAMLRSQRVAAAPTVAQVLTLETPRSDTPAIAARNLSTVATSVARAPNDLQRSLVAGTARRLQLDGAATLATIGTRQQAIDFFKRQQTMAHR